MAHTVKNANIGRDEARQRRLFNIYRRYLRKHQQAQDNYLRHADSGNWRRADYWYRQAGKWGIKKRRQFPWFCA